MVPQMQERRGALQADGEPSLGYAAARTVRLPPDTTKDERAQVSRRLLEELEMTRRETAGRQLVGVAHASARQWR